MKRFEAIRYRKTIEKAASLQNDEAALDNIFIFPKWEENLPNEKYLFISKNI